MKLYSIIIVIDYNLRVKVLELIIIGGNDMEQKVYRKNITTGFIYAQVTVAIITYVLLILIQITDLTALYETIVIVLITTTFFYLVYNGKVIIDADGLGIDRCWYPIDKIISLHISYIRTDNTGTIAILDLNYRVNTTETWEKRIYLSSYDKELEEQLKTWCNLNNITLECDDEIQHYKND